MPSFTLDLYRFLADLGDHNDRDWFAANKGRYLEHVQQPALRFIAAFEPHLHAISPHFVASAKAQGGSLFRIHRDTRFSNDKRPYKTNTGVQFRHEQGKDAHAPGFYMHLEPGEVFVGFGIWHPDNPTLGLIRDRIVEEPDRWSLLKADLSRSGLDLMTGEALVRPPRGYDPNHVHVEDLKLKNYAVSRRFDPAEALREDWLDVYVDHARAAAPFMRFLCDAVRVPF